MDTTFIATSEPDPRDKKKYYFADTSQRRALIALARSFFWFFMEMDVKGLEHLPREGPVVLAANHVTTFDVFPMQFALPRVIFFMGKAELFRNPLMDVLLRNLSGFPVMRGEKDLWAMRHAARVLKHGQMLGMFPEGTRSKGKGLGVAKTGAARLAIEADCPILPIAIVGSDRFFKRFPRRTRVQISLLPPLIPKQDENPLALTDRLMFTLAQALPEDMRGVYAEMPEGFKI
ncbi:MAG: 1-acyl-sn-glycerol-3-phosphate acyltransferase [Anaerolineae bacterium]|nr:1-acyl-sn-glycerol-3-phosphate acyltransferase [Anaerolineae bacterium]MCI0607586.1 1-acyl-sn-glycerol-3-phosphate acyltransferase [Anaerolineae bacterium]